MFKTVLKIVFFSLLTGLAFIVAWQTIFEKLSDSELWTIAVFSVIIGSIIGYFLRDKYMPGKLGISIIWVLISLTFLMIIYGIYGAILNKDIFIGNKYEGMAGMLPYLVLISSLIPVFLAYMAKLFTKNNVN